MKFLFDLTFPKEIIMIQYDNKKTWINRKLKSDIRFEAQDANVDRCFHLFLKLTKANARAPNADETAEALIIISGVGKGILRQDSVARKLKRTALRVFRDLSFDKQAGGGLFHRYEHPFLVSPKRWCNGAACFCEVSSMGQLLNIMNNKKKAMSQILKFDGLFLKEMDYYIKHFQFTSDELLLYLTSRVTYWLFHQLLKGTINCLFWAGKVDGNALSVNFVEG